MNSFSAWPSPAKYGDALVCLQHAPGVGAEANRPRSDSVQDVVPVEAARAAKKYWHFIGLKGDPRIDGLAEKNKQLLPDPAQTPPSRRPMPRHQSSFGARIERDEQSELASRQTHADVIKKADRKDSSKS